MVSRHWTGWIKHEEADNYEQYLAKHLLPELALIDDFAGIIIYKRMDNSAVEFLVVTNWLSMDAIKKFAGTNPSVAVVGEEAKKMMVRYDKEVRHYEIKTI